MRYKAAISRNSHRGINEKFVEIKWWFWKVLTIMILANVRNSENDEKFAITRNSSTYGKEIKKTTRNKCAIAWDKVAIVRYSIQSHLWDITTKLYEK